MRPGTRAVLMVLAAVLCGVAHAETLNEHVDTPNEEYRIHYYNRDTSNTNWFTDEDEAEAIGEDYDRDGSSTEGNPLGAHDGYVRLGFKEPKFDRELGADRDIKLKDDDNPNSNEDRIIIPPHVIQKIGAWSFPMQQVNGHELFHNVQFAYLGDGNKLQSLMPFSYEGTATAMMDAIFDDCDGCARLSWTWLKHAANYLRLNTQDNIFEDVGNRGYHASIFWKYLMEQFGSDRTEPHTGHDVIERFFELAEANGYGASTTLGDVLDEKDRYTTSASDTGTSLAKVFQDFAVANWIRRYINPNVSGYTLDVDDPARFYYLDENTSPTASLWDGDADPYDDQPRADATHTLGPGNHVSRTGRAVDTWGSLYLQCQLSNGSLSADDHGVGFWVTSDATDSLMYSLIGVRASGSIDLVAQGSSSPGIGNDFHYAVVQRQSDPYERLIAVASGLMDAADVLGAECNFDYYFGYFQPTLEIKYPTTNYCAYVGDHLKPERFVVKLKVTSPDYLDSGSLKGLSADQFDVYVGSLPTASNKAEVLAAADNFGEYWLTVQAPVKTTAPSGPVPLYVYLGSVVDAIQEPGPIIYDFLDVDQMLVIDRSGSMSKTSGGFARIDGARAAAQLFTEATGSDDMLGTVRFNGNWTETGDTNYMDAEVFTPLLSMSNQWVRDTVNWALDETNPGGDMLTATGATSIGDGLYWGAKELVDNGRAEAEKWIVLLSDGHQNEDSDYDAHKSLLDVSGIHVESVILGPNCDEGLLQTIATDTGGWTYKVEADEDAAPSVAGAPAAIGDASIMHDLANTFLLINEDIKRKSRIMESAVSVAAGATNTLQLSIVEGGLEDAVIALFYGKQNAVMDLTVQTPAGTNLPPPDAGDPGYDPEYHVAYRTATMGAGQWSFVIENGDTETIDCLLVVSAKNRQGAQAQLYFPQYHGLTSYYNQNGRYLVGLPMPVSVVLTDADGPILDADITATVTHPLKSDVVLRLRDDGGGYDGSAGDGVYGACYAATTEGTDSGGNYAETNPPPALHGCYRVVANISGEDNFSNAFFRVKHGTFHVFRSEQGQGGDTDGDGMVDRYEDLHACLDKSVHDSGGDPDGDGVDSGNEYKRGINPGNADTDGGGESDGSELGAGANPLDYLDDAVPPPILADVFNRPTDMIGGIDLIKPNQNVIRFSVERGYHSVNLYRAAGAATNAFVLVTNLLSSVTEGIYEDGGLVNGVPYFYRIEALDAAGRSGVKSGIFAGTPKSDPIPPVFDLAIDRGASATFSNVVELTLHASSDVTQMKLGLTPDLSGSPWLAYTNRIAAFSLGSPSPGDIVSVYGIVRDVANNRTEANSVIHYVSAASNTLVHGRARAVLDTTDRGVAIRLEGPDHRGTTTGDSGRFRVVVPPGTYAFHATLRGYQPVLQTGVVAVAGSDVDMGLITLVPLDRDGDGVKDVHELRDHYTDRDLADTDGDGLDDGDEIIYTKTDPTNAASVLQFSGGTRLSNGFTRITWDSVEGVTYDVSWMEAVTSATWNALASVPAATGVTETTYVDNTTTTTEMRFYRIGVSGP